MIRIYRRYQRTQIFRIFPLLYNGLFYKLCLFIMVICAPAEATPLLADLSNYQITMNSTFNGTKIFVFGTRNDAGDIIVVVRGPTKNYIVRKKKEIAGVWVNAERMKFYRTPDFYAVASSKPMNELDHNNMFRQLALGQEFLFNLPTNALSYKEFTDAFITHQKKRHLYNTDPMPLTFMGETLFKTVINFPDNIPPGTYNAEIYLLKENMIVGTHVIPIEVSKVGIDAFLYDYAHHHPFLYGITAVVLALSAGWFAGRLFERV